MLIKTPKSWEISENQTTPEVVFKNRRKFMRGMIGAATIASAGLSVTQSAAQAATSSNTGLYPAPRNPAFQDAGRPVTDEKLASTYNNFYEFASHKQIWQAAQALPTDPWKIEIDGLVAQPLILDFGDLIRKLPIEERIYRHRCVERWSMTVPWSGFPMRKLVDLAQPHSDAKFVRFETFHNPDIASGQRQFWYPWPYVEGITMAEAQNNLSFLVTGAYGKPLAKQFGAPLRLALPWKYGFKSIKSIVRISFTDKRPVSFWEQTNNREYGFWANINPNVPHPRWSQAVEEPLGSNDRVPTLLFNGYEAQVAELYKDLSGRTLFM